VGGNGTVPRRPDESIRSGQYVYRRPACKIEAPSIARAPPRWQAYRARVDGASATRTKPRELIASRSLVRAGTRSVKGAAKAERCARPAVVVERVTAPWRRSSIPSGAI